jgi:predicted ATPase/DNA-binding NarL/FixJ family response regulator/DNA-binding XRE family transcriptional regulator
MLTVDSEQSFGGLLREYRLTASLTQAVLAKRAGISTRSVQAIERGLSQPHRETVQRLETALGLLPDEQATFRCAVNPSPRRSRSPVAKVQSVRSIVRHNLPLQLTSFIGRARELDAVRGRLSETRLLTLTGPGGVGKTRLALQAADDTLDGFKDGVFFMPLATIMDPEQVSASIAAVLDIRPVATRSLQDSLKKHLRARSLLLILDNFEHLAGAAGLVAELLAASPGLTVLATSRDALHLYGEHVFRVPPMALPDQRTVANAQSLDQCESSRLFAERARASKSDFAVTDQNATDVAALCQRLDGLPLAIELAAARLRSLPLPTLLTRLEQRLPLLTGGPQDLPGRQQTLRNTIAWSYDLLDRNEQALFRRLAVFRGVTLDAVGTVCCESAAEPGSSSIALPPVGLDALAGLTALVDKNLLQQQETAEGEPWYSMLETIREYALERLAETGETDAVHRRHALYYLNLAEAADQDLTGPLQVQSFALLDGEHDNLRAALRWCAEHAYAEPALRLAVALWWFWAVRGHVTEGRNRLAELLMRFQPRQATGRLAAIRARALLAAGHLAAFQEDHAAARPLYEEALRLFEKQGDEAGVGSAVEAVGRVASLQGDHQTAVKLLEQSVALARAWGEPMAIGSTLLNLANVVQTQGDFDRARALIEEGLAIKEKISAQRELAIHTINLGAMAEAQGDYQTARSLFERSLSMSRHGGDQRTTALALAHLGSVATHGGDYAAAHDRLRDSAEIQQALGEQAGMAFVLERLAVLAAAQAQPARAMRLSGAAAALREAIDSPLPPDAQAELENALQPARRRLGEMVATAAWTAGHGLSSDEAVAEALRTSQPSRPASADAVGTADSSLLSPREKEVAVLISRGLTNRQIASELVITEGTVGTHVVHILAKLGASSRAAIAVWAVEHGLAATLAATGALDSTTRERNG